MSSTYRILCLSHDPATTHGEYRTPDSAAAVIAAGIDGHPACDLLIGRYSYPLIEVGCPPTRDQPPGHPCAAHGGTVWADAALLRLLTAAYRSPDSAIRTASGDGRFRCWSPERLRRLRVELGIEEDPADRTHPRYGDRLRVTYEGTWHRLGDNGYLQIRAQDNPNETWHNIIPKDAVVEVIGHDSACEAEAPQNKR